MPVALHNSAMRPLTRLQNEQKSCAILNDYYFPSPLGGFVFSWNIFDIHNGRAVEDVQTGNLDSAAVHGQDFQLGNGNGVRAHGAAGGEHTT